MTSRKRLVISIGALLLIYGIGVAGYMVLDRDHSLLDAMYMVTITLSTVGSRETVAPTPGVMVWTMFLIVVGVISAMVVLGSVTGWIVSGEVGRLIGSRKLESRIKHMQSHVIICGMGRMGRMLAKQLQQRRVDVVVIENDPETCRQAEEMKLLYIVGDATDETSMEKAGIKRAKCLVTVLRNDADNVFATLTAREMQPKLLIVARAEQFSAEPKLRRAGANRVISPQAIGADRIANVITRPHLVDFVEVAAKGLDFEMDAVVVSNDSPIAGKTLREADIRATANVMVVAIREPDGTIRFNPSAEARLRPEDTLITIGPTGAASRLAHLKIIATAEEPVEVSGPQAEA